MDDLQSLVALRTDLAVPEDTTVYSIDPVRSVMTKIPASADIVGLAKGTRDYSGYFEGSDTLVGSSRIDIIWAHWSDDVAKGKGGHDFIDGGDGRDRLYGGSGNDQIDGGANGDRIFGGSGRDHINGDESRATLEGEGKDHIYGSRGADWLNGNGGADKIFGQGGNDIIYGGKGNDTLSGGAGRDTFVFGKALVQNKGHGRDTITDFNPAADTIEIFGLSGGFKKLDIMQVGENVEVSFARTKVTLLDVEVDDISKSVFTFDDRFFEL